MDTINNEKSSIATDGLQKCKNSESRDHTGTLYYLLDLPLNFLFALQANGWWLFDHNESKYLHWRVILFFLVVQAVFAYESGYKKAYLKNLKPAFFIAHAFPLATTLISFVFGIVKLDF